jgi:hypothetical protein
MMSPPPYEEVFAATDSVVAIFDAGMPHLKAAKETSFQ